MSSGGTTGESTGALSKLHSVILSRPWLYPFIYLLYSLQGATLDDVRNAIGLRTQLVKRALWWLTKSGLIEEQNGRLYIRKEFTKGIEELRLSTCIMGGRYIVKLGEAYLVIELREGSIDYWAVPSKLYEALVELEKNAGAEFTSKEVSQALSISIGTASRLLRLRRMLRECWSR